MVAFNPEKPRNKEVEAVLEAVGKAIPEDAQVGDVAEALTFMLWTVFKNDAPEIAELLIPFATIVVTSNKKAKEQYGA